MARSMRPVAGTGTMGPPPNPDPRPGTKVYRNPMGPSGTENTPQQGQNKPVRYGGDPAGAGRFRGTAKVAAALAKRAPTVPYRGEAQQVNASRDGRRPGWVK